MKSYKIIKLKSGEDLIGNVRIGKDGAVKIHRPMVFKSTIQSDLFGGIKEIYMLKDWLILSDEKIAVISKDSINTIVNASVDISHLYEAEKIKEDSLPPLKPKARRPKPSSTSDKTPFDVLEKHIQEMIAKAEEQDMIDEKETNLKDIANPQKGDKMVFMSMVFSPEIIIKMLKTGMLDRKEFGEIINEITNENGEGMNPQKYTGNKKDKKNLGNDWTDWPANPDASDYK